MKKCPDCADDVKADAKICRFCRHDFTSARR
ncbi:zinc ribbon domain-containing protein [Mesorhizobium cantuariense]|uniref:Zinc ribbon domain-containing protein n=1 Tax=Mesorhizobium cantuariense TaxID=1300275 RepID=A0ABV7MLW1_9HYPH